jgi:ubiquinone/menaquinone biosynthesis C-methylase UbiE
MKKIENKNISDWWNKNMNDSMLPTFKGWVGDYNSETKKFSREYIESKNYKSIIDIGCALCDMYYGFKNEKYEIDYTGLDSCQYFIDKNKELAINVIKSDMNKINIRDNSYDVVFARHVLEHLPTFKDALSEFIRISSKEVIVIFFIKPLDKEEIRYDNTDLYHNIYSKKEIENFISKYNYEWNDINDKEIILHIKK